VEPGLEYAILITLILTDARTLVESIRRMERFRQEWEAFVDGLIKEWKTLNVVSALLLRWVTVTMNSTHTHVYYSALLTFFQIEEGAFEPVTRTAALLSLISAFLSLMFGGMYIIRFSTMRSMRKAAKWVEVSIFLSGIFVLISFPGSQEKQEGNSLECLDSVIHACRMACILFAILLCGTNGVHLDIR
jgi:hypothetical protein